ncbi:MAG: hypothetical protein EXQ69_08620 [Acidimicrobiia bacterium]|nr:hypothetical protein [Acidimicrobiia bacterium]
METEVLLTGIGGQGVQLCAAVLARAATIEDRYVMLFGVYAGAMRGMNTDATVVIGDAALQSPPLISHASAAVGMHDKFWEPVNRKLRPGSLLCVNDATFETPLDSDLHRVLRVPATDIATDMGMPMAASMVMAGAFGAVSELVTVESLIAAMRDSIPSYRVQHIEGNELAIAAGHQWGCDSRAATTR